MDFLVFRLYGAMASWGEAAVGGSRPSAITPSRSAILGLLGAALGIKREDTVALEQLRQNVRIGIKQLCSGHMMRDYHTAEVPSPDKKRRFYTRKDELSHKDLHTILSARDYRAEGLWTIAVWIEANSDKKTTLEHLALALKQPKFMLSLGRKSCPIAAPMQPMIIENTNLKTALDTEFAGLMLSEKEEARRLKRDKFATYFWEGNIQLIDTELAHVQTLTKWDEPLDRNRWQFTSRFEHQVSIEQGSE